MTGIKKLKLAGTRRIIGVMALRHLFLSLLTIIALGGCASQPHQVDDRILITDVNLHKGQITMTFKSTGESRVYYVNGLTMIAVPMGAGQLRDVHAGYEVFSYHATKSGKMLDSLIVGYSDPMNYF